MKAYAMRQIIWRTGSRLEPRQRAELERRPVDQRKIYGMTCLVARLARSERVLSRASAGKGRRSIRILHRRLKMLGFASIEFALRAGLADHDIDRLLSESSTYSKDPKEMQRTYDGAVRSLYFKRSLKVLQRAVRTARKHLNLARHGTPLGTLYRPANVLLIVFRDLSFIASYSLEAFGNDFIKLVHGVRRRA